MAQKKEKKTKIDKKKGKIAIAATVVAITAAAGAYFLYGTKEGARQRKRIRGSALRMKGEVLKKIENLKDVNEETYRKIIDAVAKKFKGQKNLNTAEVTALVDELKSHWKNLRRQFESERLGKARRTRKASR